MVRSLLNEYFSGCYFRNRDTKSVKLYSKALLVAKKFGNKFFGNDWIFQQDGATAHTGNLTQKWCGENFPAFIDKNRWPPNSPDLNPLDYSIWNELVQNLNWEKVE